MAHIRAVALCLAVLAVVPLAAATLTVTNVNDSGAGSLRAALAAAQAGDRIEFSIGSGHQRIQPLSLLPGSAGCVAVDGTTQPGYAGTPLIEINGSLVSGSIFSTNGLAVCGLVQGLILNDWKGAGIAASSDAGPTQIRACYIGTNADGTDDRPNGIGVYTQGSSFGSHLITIGGGSPGDGNLISGNGAGVQVAGGVVTIQGNTFGSDAAQTRTLNTSTNHVSVQYNTLASVTVGGIAPNYFLGGRRAIESIYSNGVVVDGNKIGVTATNRLIPNRFGIYFSMSNDGVARNNVVAGGERGIQVEGASLRNVLSRNSMRNAMIDLARYPDDGPTPNDPGDEDVGPNNFTNYPVITSATATGGTTTIAGTLPAAPNRTYTIELFRSVSCSGGFGQAETFLESFTVTTDSAGNASFLRTVSPAIPAGNVITATATTALEGTSELSPCREVQGNGRLSFGTVHNTTEGGELGFFVNRDLGSIGTVTANWNVTGGTANPSHYVQASGVVSFGPGETFKLIRIQTVDDAILTGEKSVTVTLSNPTGGATLGPQPSATAFIHDDDPLPTIEAAPRLEVDEGNAGIKAVAVAVRLSHAVGIPIQVFYGTGSSSAFGGADFVHTSGSLTFAPGETQKTITVQIIGDETFESDETFWLELRVNFAFTWISVVIRNDDVRPTVSVEDASVVETDGGTTVQVRFTATAEIAGSIVYSIASYTATANVDFTHTGTFLHFSNQKTRTITVTINGDDEPEPDETFIVTLHSVPFMATIADGTATVAILNDDTGVGPRDQMIAVGETGSYMIDVGQPRQAPAVILLGSSDPSAVSVPNSVTLPAGKSSVIFAARALKAGAFANISIKMPPELEGDVYTLRAYTYAKSELVFDPGQLRLYAGQTIEVRAKLDPAAAEAVIVPLSVDGGLEAPSRLTIPPGQTATFTVKATKTGPAAIRARLPRDYGDRETMLFAEVTETPATPTILRISPPNGATAGGTSVELEGVAFTRDCTVAFGNLPASSVRFLTSTLLTAVTPPHDKGVVDVVLTCGELRSTFTSAFVYVDSAPRISHVAPSTGSTAGGTQVRIAGSDLRSSCWPFFGGTPAPAAVLESASSMLAATPPHAAGGVDVTLRCTGGDATASEAFLYTAGDDPAPSIMTVTPLAAAPGEEVTIRGTRFRANDRVTFGSAAAPISGTGPDEHVVVLPELPPGRISVNLTDVEGRLTTTGPIFAVLEASRPRITGVVPPSAPAGAEIELQGEGFRAGYSFSIGGRAAAIVSSSYTRAVVRLSGELAPGRYDIDVINSAGNLAAIGPAVTVTSDGLAIASVSARCSTTDGGEEVTITGSGFEGSMLVSFAGRLAGAATVVDANTLLAVVPPGEAGPAQIRVTRADGATATWTGGFRYASPFDPNGCNATLRGGRAVRH